jgi:flagellar motor protein MotB
VKRDARQPLFPVNVWPPFVDALTLVLAVFVLIMVAAAVAQSGLVARLRKSDDELARVRAEKARIERRLRALAASGAIEVDDGKVIMQGEVLFASGSDELSAAGRHALAELDAPLAALLTAEPDQMILVGGHTDDRPIANARFASNWELSAARATTVVRYLIDTDHIQATRLMAAGFGEFHPIVPNDTREHRALNRRVEIHLLSTGFTSPPPPNATPSTGAREYLDQ